MAKYYITTPIYYINDIPHIGHAYTTIAADVLARYHRKKGDEVFFLTGTDEHGAKIAEAAEKAGKTPQDFVDSLEPKFKEAWKNLNISYDEFFRTTNPSHEKLVQEFVRKLVDKGFVEKRSYEGLYCIACEKFLKESELVDGCCPDHKKPPVKQKEENYFFLLSKFGDQLLKKIESGEFEIGPEHRKNEIVGKIKQGLDDISISRAAVEWGVKFPSDESQTIYVWIDALLNYYTATKIFHKEDYWPANLHLMAKDILWFHAIIWPAMLMAVELDLPKKVFAHGFFTVGGQKMSKTIGNVIDPNKLVEKFGADAVRYALLREFPFGEDGDISEEKIALRYEKDLANGLGNLLNRTLNMFNKYEIQIKLPKQLFIDKENFSDSELSYYGDLLKYIEYDTSLSSNQKTTKTHRYWILWLLEKEQFSAVLYEIWNIIAATNAFIENNKPWELAKLNQAKLRDILNVPYESLEAIKSLIEPFMPETAKKMKTQLETLKPEPLFPRLD